jgi:hypothetical protein
VFDKGISDVTYAERTLNHLWAIAPDGATNAEIARRLGTTSHQTVYMLMQDLLRRGLVRGEQQGRTWVFYAVEEPADRDLPRSQLVPDELPVSGSLTPSTFEALARRVLGERYAVALAPGSVPGVRKQFDFVSPDQQIVGDAKYYTLVRGTALPPAKFATIAEHVWLLEKTGAPTTFLVFGNDREVPARWLARYGNLVTGVAFYFLADDGRLVLLTPVGASP